MRTARAVGFTFLFVIAPAALAAGPRWLLTLCILLGGGVCLALLLADSSFDRRELFDVVAMKRGLPRVLVRTAYVWAGLFAIVYIARPSALFHFPRTRPVLWLAVMVGYSLVSVYPQEIMFRTFVRRRCCEWGVEPAIARILASAALFGWAHVALHNLPAMALSTLGGWLFASTFERSRSTLLVTIEHALYGGFIFSVGLGDLFYAGRGSLLAGLPP